MEEKSEARTPWHIIEASPTRRDILLLDESMRGRQETCTIDLLVFSLPSVTERNDRFPLVNKAAYAICSLTHTHTRRSCCARIPRLNQGHFPMRAIIGKRDICLPRSKSYRRSCYSKYLYIY